MNAKTQEQLDAGELYPHCPRCDRTRMISVCTDPGGDYRPSRWEYISCPLCYGTGEAEADAARAYMCEQAEEAW